QTFALITAPFAGLHYSIAGSHDGLILFMRRLYLIFSAGVAVMTWGLIRRSVDEVSAFFIALCCVGFSPMYIATLSYNTLGWGFYLIGVLTLFEMGLKLKPAGIRRLLCIGGVFGLGTICYPTLLLPELFTLVLSVWPLRTMS